MNILHVVRVADDPHRRDACDAQAVVCAAAIRAGSSATHRVLIVGPEAAQRRAAALGLHCHGRASTVLGRCGGAARGIARIARAWNAAEIIQTYGLDTVAAASAATPRRLLLADCLGTLAAAPDLNGLPPRLGSSGLPHRSRAQTRASLGVEDRELLVIALGDPPGQIDAHAMSESVAMLNVAGVTATAVVPRGARGLERAQRHAVEGYMQRLIVTDESVWSLLPGADIGVVALLPPGPTLSTRLLARHAIDLGVPVVAPAGPEWEHLGGAAWPASENRGSRLAGACFRWLESNRPPPSPTGDPGPSLADRIVAIWREGRPTRDAA